MKASRSLLPILALLLGACRSAPMERERFLYAPHEEGLTLAYENPTLAESARKEARLQIRVDSARPLVGVGALSGAFRHTRLTGEEAYTFEVKDGGLQVFDAQKQASLLLPEGFPERTTDWSAGGTRNRILGRGSSPAVDKVLPRKVPKMGVWIESTPELEGGARIRTLLYPDIGPVEVLEWRDRKWVAVSRLVARGFTDTSPEPRPTPPQPRNPRK